MTRQAPYRFIRNYYLESLRKKRSFPETSGFWRGELAHVAGPRVLNLGCGPTFFEYIEHFSAAPAEYVGLDINAATMRFLARSQLPALRGARRRAVTAGVKTHLICANASDDVLRGRFDCVLGVGFFGIFRGAQFDRLVRLARDLLAPGGRLVKITWHGADRPPSEERRKRLYGFDAPPALAAEPAPHELVDAIEAQGFTLEHHRLQTCDPGYGWRLIQCCVFGVAGS